MTFDEFKTLCDRRRSVRYFSGEPVSKRDVLQLLEAARMSPSVQNMQPWHFHVILNEDLKTTLMKTSYYGDFVQGAGAFLVVTCNTKTELFGKEPLWNLKEMEYSCMGAMSTILLGATALGIGSCWVSLSKGDVHKLLRLPENELVIGGIMLGHYKKNEEMPSGEHERKPLEKIYTMHE